MNATYATAVAYGKPVNYTCGRCMNNRGHLLVWRLGNQLWRSDTRQKTTVSDLIADGWNYNRPSR